MDEAARSEPTHLSERTDIELVGDVLLGSARAATELVRRHRLSMYRVALRLTHDAHDADDVTQEAFIQTFRKLRQFKQQCAFRTWLYRITVNTAFMALRRRRSVKESMLRHLELDGGTTNFDPPDTTGPASDEVAIVHQLADNMAKAMNALPEIHRTALILCTCEDLTGSEVAESLSTSELNVKMRLFRARAALRRSLASVEAG